MELGLKIEKLRENLRKKSLERENKMCKGPEVRRETDIFKEQKEGQYE